MKSKVWAGLAIVFATASVALLYGMLDSSVSYSYCADELEHVGNRQLFLEELLRSLSPHITRDELDAAARRTGVNDAFDKSKHERVVSGIGFVFDDAGRLQRIEFD